MRLYAGFLEDRCESGSQRKPTLDDKESAGLSIWRVDGAAAHPYSVLSIDVGDANAIFWVSNDKTIGIRSGGNDNLLYSHVFGVDKSNNFLLSGEFYITAGAETRLPEVDIPTWEVRNYLTRT